MVTKIKFPRGVAVGIFGVAVLTACSSNHSAATGKRTPANAVATTTTLTTSAAAATTTATTTTSTGGWVASPNGAKGESDVADNFNVQSTLQPDPTTVPVMADPVGAFRFECLSGQLAKDDPIVYPGQPGKSHLHQFFGNMLTNASSTYQSLRTSGGSTCTGNANSTDPTPQRSAYWMPAMLDGAGNAVKPNRMLTYYKQLPNNNPECGAAPDSTHIGYCVAMPNGLRMITGYNMDSGKGGPADTTSADQWTMHFDCWLPTGAVTPAEPTLAAVVATGTCPAGSLLRVLIDFPQCWDGKNLDSPDHRAHMSDEVGAALPDGSRACPSDHPYNIPSITIQAFFTTDANFVAGKWHLSSDDMLPGAAAGTTLHGDYWEAWSPTIKNQWQVGCIDAHLSCNNGQLGNGQTIKGMPQGPWPDHVLVPLSSIP
ncbi:MAG TPA: DUF1996 domain-containing protein [Sphingomicrobium sp.]|nr:DUF1996 domain-containing protein [Sphingomicrobium sp.]